MSAQEQVSEVNQADVRMALGDILRRSREEATRWDDRRRLGGSDDDIRLLLVQIIPKNGRSGNKNGMQYFVARAPELAFWCGSFGQGAPTLNDQQVVEMTRQIFE